MKNKLFLKLSALCLCSYATVNAVAGPTYKEICPPPSEPKFYFTINAGAEFDVHATHFLNDADDIYVLPLSPLLPGVVIDARTRLNSRSFSATHEPAVAYRGDFGYNINSWLSLFVGFAADHARGRNFLHNGLVSIDTPLGTFATVVESNVTSYDGYAGHAGFRVNVPEQYLAWTGLPPAIRMFGAYTAGGKWVSEQHIVFSASVLDLLTVATDVESLYQGSWVFTNDAQFGLEWVLTPNASFGVQGGVGYDTKPSRADNGAPFPYSTGVNKGGDRLYFPVGMFAKVQF